VDLQRCGNSNQKYYGLVWQYGELFFGGWKFWVNVIVSRGGFLERNLREWRREEKLELN